MIQLQGIRKSYAAGTNRLEVLKGIDLHVRKGELVSIMGSSGSGKSTLLNILGILDDFDAGSYHLAGTRIDGSLSQARAAHYRNQFLGFVFQSFNLLSFKSAVENVALPLYYQQVGRRERTRRALDYLDRMGLREWADHRPSELSGGQKQRVAIARALISQPKLILADEPTGALDTQTTQEVMDIFKQVNRQGMTVVIITHEHDIAAQTHRMVRVRDGRIVPDGDGTDALLAAHHLLAL